MLPGKLQALKKNGRVNTRPLDRFSIVSRESFCWGRTANLFHVNQIGRFSRWCDVDQVFIEFEEFAVGLGRLQLVDQELDAVLSAHRVQDAAQDVHLLEIVPA